MSQLSNSTTNTNICSDLSAITADNKAISTGTEKGKKRATPLPPAGQAKNNMTVHHSCGEQAPKVTSTCVDQSKFVTAAEIYIKIFVKYFKTSLDTTRKIKFQIHQVKKTTTTTTTNTTKYSDSIMASTQPKETNELSAQIMKQSISSDIPMEVKKMMVHHDHSKQKSQFVAAAPPPMKFGSAATMVASKNTSSDAIPEISDEELLEMTLAFEKQQQQQQQ
ncbi:unnamed protein product [Rotaria magnacalcarata]|uniref:Uncharacterized protein n=2 Tax=Rotaria magnacalcarata TaxID=392030 RepID=A0A8S2L041_9BILA|nr:unnamed protein product [Rotaria magnacalcarata]CAF3880785.1 unnamed protein product [Rotaria magnacalcarata]CAF3892642.1 unnamed protein product [Rotaria magnacalcarata]